MVCLMRLEGGPFQGETRKHQARLDSATCQVSSSALHSPLTCSTVPTAWISSWALDSVNSTKTRSSFRAVFTTRRY